MRRVTGRKSAMTPVQRKIERQRNGKPLRVLDLFSGCGGISLGFQGAGFQIDADSAVNILASMPSHATPWHNYVHTIIIIYL